MIRWLKKKWNHISPQHLKKTLKEHGLAFLVIFLIWEVIEDIGFPILFYWLGNNVNPWFHTAIPVSWLLCLHGIMVPLTWAVWVRLRRRQEKPNSEKKDSPSC